MMGAFWITFKGGSKACVEVDYNDFTSNDAAKEAETKALALATELKGETATHAKRLPYPANPRLNKMEFTTKDGVTYTTPSFCYRPTQCAGKTCCPHAPCCTS